jgi:hypothetical protein
MTNRFSKIYPRDSAAALSCVGRKSSLLAGIVSGRSVCKFFHTIGEQQGGCMIGAVFEQETFRIKEKSISKGDNTRVHIFV